MRIALRALLVVAAAVLGGTAALILVADRGAGPALLPAPPTASPTATPEPIVALVGIDCTSRPAGADPSRASPSAPFETCTGSVRIVGPTPVSSLDVWVDSLDATGRPFFSCRARVGESAAAGAVLTWKTVCELQPGTSAHRVHFSDRAGTPLRTAAPGQ